MRCPCYRRRSTNPPTWETDAEDLAQFFKVVLEVDTSFLVILAQLWNVEVLEHVQIHDTGNGRLHEEKGAVHSFFAEGAKHVQLWAVTNMFQEDTWICAAPDPTVVGIDLTTGMKCTLSIYTFKVAKLFL
jgi:hypothetical protein